MSEQTSLFGDIEDKFTVEWHDMPEFVMNNKEPLKQLIVSFRSWEDYKEFSKLIEQNLTSKTQSVWFPKATIETYADKVYK